SAAPTSSPHRRGAWAQPTFVPRSGRGVRLVVRPLVLAQLVVLLLMASFVGAAHGQSGQTDANQSAFGPIGTISAPHGAGVLPTNVQTGVSKPSRSCHRSA